MKNILNVSNCMRTSSTNYVGSRVKRIRIKKETIKVTLPKKMVAIPCNNTIFLNMDLSLILQRKCLSI